MAADDLPPGDLAARARAWRDRRQALVCDVLEPWAHGTVERASRYPSYFDFNVVRVEGDLAMGVEELAAFADEALAGLAHRRIDFDDVRAAVPLRADFGARGWKAVRLLWMRHDGSPQGASGLAVEAVGYDDVRELRVAWLREDFPDQEPDEYLEQAREVASRGDVEVLALRDGGRPVAFAQLERADAAAEVAQVYVHPEYRGGGRGTAMTRAAIAAAGDVDDLWIIADDENRPKQLYARLGFRPAWTTMEFTRVLPG